MADPITLRQALLEIQERIDVYPYPSGPMLLHPNDVAQVRGLLGLAPDTPITWDHLAALEQVRRG